MASVANKEGESGEKDQNLKKNFQGSGPSLDPLLKTDTIVFAGKSSEQIMVMYIRKCD